MLNRDLRFTGLALLAWGLGEGMFLNIIPIYLEELGADPVRIGVIMAFYMFSQAMVLLPGGLAADRWGTKKVMVIGWTFGIGVAVVMALVSNLFLFSLALIGYGLTCWPIPALTTYIAHGRGQLTPQRSMARVYAFYSAGLIVSPSIGGLIAQYSGFRSIFILSIIFFILSTLFVGLLKRQPIMQIESSSLRYKSLFRNRDYILLIIIMVVMDFSLYIGIPLAPIFLKERWGLNLSEIGLLGSAASFGEVVLSLFLGNFKPKKSLVALLITGMAYLVILLSTGSIIWLAAAYFLRVGVSLSRQFIDAMSTQLVSPSQYGFVFGINATFGRIASVLASGGAGWLYGMHPNLPFQTSLVFIPAALILLLVFLPKKSAIHQTVDAGS